MSKTTIISDVCAQNFTKQFCASGIYAPLAYKVKHVYGVFANLEFVLETEGKKFRIGNLEFVQLKTVLLPSIQLSLKLILLVKYESLDYRQPEVPNKWYQVPTVRVFLINVANFWTV